MRRVLWPCLDTLQCTKRPGRVLHQRVRFRHGSSRRAGATHRFARMPRSFVVVPVVTKSKVAGNYRIWTRAPKYFWALPVGRCPCASTVCHRPGHVRVRRCSSGPSATGYAQGPRRVSNLATPVLSCVFGNTKQTCTPGGQPASAKRTSGSGMP